MKLRHLEAWNEMRGEAALRYNELLRSYGEVTIPHEPDWSRAIYHLYVIRTADRDAMQKGLAAAKVGTGLHYPVPLHLQSAFAGGGFSKGDYPVAEKATAEILSLPMFPGLTGEQQQRVSDAIGALATSAAAR